LAIAAAHSDGSLFYKILKRQKKLEYMKRRRGKYSQNGMNLQLWDNFLVNPEKNLKSRWPLRGAEKKEY